MPRDRVRSDSPAAAGLGETRLHSAVDVQLQQFVREWCRGRTGNALSGFADRHRSLDQNQVTSKNDQNGTVHAFDFDKLGRQTADRITTVGTGIDTAVRRISTSFEVRGLVQNLTGFDNATVGSGSVFNDVQFAYNRWSSAFRLRGRRIRENPRMKWASDPATGQAKA